MRLGILQCGLMAPELVERFGDYPRMYRELYQGIDSSVEMPAYLAVEGEFPTSPDACDAWLLTGSRHGVYDELPWIDPLKDFLRAARGRSVPMVGICFGHQILAEAFGGKVEKSDKGWGAGVHHYAIDRRPGWMADAGDGFAMHAMHQDQVIAVPGDANCLASSPFCQYAMLSYGDPETPDAISIQPHPEFTREIAEAIVDMRTLVLPAKTAAAAHDSFGATVAGPDFARWSLDYLRRALAGRAAA